jgi:hypothetical protein
MGRGAGAPALSRERGGCMKNRQGRAVARVALWVVAAAALVAGTIGPSRAAVRQTTTPPPPCGLVNGGMEDVAPTLTPRDWNVSNEVRSSPRAHNGERAVQLYGLFGTVSQTISVHRTAAEGATLTFWLRRDANLDAFNFKVTLGGIALPVSLGPADVPVDTFTPFVVAVPAAVFNESTADLVFSFTRTSITGLLDLDDVELDLCPYVSPTPGPTGMHTPVPDTSLCAVRNGGFESLDGVRPRYWDWTGNVEATTRAMFTGVRAVRFTQGNATLTQTFVGLPALERPARLFLWVYREQGAGGFRLTAHVGSEQLLDFTPANLPVGAQPMAIAFNAPAPGPGGTLTLSFEWAMDGSGAVYLDDVALDLCQGSIPTVTTTPTASLTPVATETFTATVPPTDAPTPSPTLTPMVLPSATDTATATATSRPTATPNRLRPIFLPYTGKLVNMPGPEPRAWGMQLPLDEDPVQMAEIVAKELPRASKAGLSIVRTNIRWDAIEAAPTTPDKFDWASTDARVGAYSRAGFDVLGTLVAYPKWATRYACGYALLPGQEDAWKTWVRETVRRYSQPPYRVTAWEVGNEVDGETVVRDDDNARPAGWGQGEPTTPLGGCWGDRAAEYKEFLRLAYGEIKSADPNARVSIGGLAYVDTRDFVTDFLPHLMAAGAGPYFDFLSYHWFPDLGQALSGVQKHRAMADIMARAGFPKPLWLTETFRMTFTGDTASESRQIPFLTHEIVEMLAQPDLQRVFWYGWMDFPTGYGNVPQYQRGIVRGDHTPKAAFPVLPYAVRYTNGIPADVSDAKVRAYRFTRIRSGEDYLIAWSKDSRPDRYTLAVPPGTVADVTWFPADQLMAGHCCSKRTVNAPNGTLTLEVGPDPLYVSLRSP